MSKKNNNELSKFISLILRHKPEVIDLKLDKQGYLNVNDLINGINNKSNFSIDFKKLEEIVNTDNKNRYSFDSSKKKIRANQGHSIQVDVGLKEIEPPEFLYHGTGEKYVDSINKKGIISKSRIYVHLSKDIDTAKNVGKRHGNPKIFRIKAKEMYKDEYKFFLSENKVWLTKYIPTKYIELI